MDQARRIDVRSRGGSRDAVRLLRNIACGWSCRLTPCRDTGVRCKLERVCTGSQADHRSGRFPPVLRGSVPGAVERNEAQLIRPLQRYGVAPAKAQSEGSASSHAFGRSTVSFFSSKSNLPCDSALTITPYFVSSQIFVFPAPVVLSMILVEKPFRVAVPVSTGF